MNREEYEKIRATSYPGLCDRHSSECSPSTAATKIWSQQRKTGLEGRTLASTDAPDEEIYLYCEFHAPRNATDIEPAGNHLDPENLEETVSKLKGPGFAKLRSELSGQFGIRLQSEGDAATLAPLTHIIMQTRDVSPAIPCVVIFDQYILDPFTGAGQFDLVERDASDVDVFDAESVKVSGGESEVTIATKSGFPNVTPVDGWSHFRKAITSDKIYSVVFAPGSAGDGIYSIKVRTLTGEQ